MKRIVDVPEEDYMYCLREEEEELATELESAIANSVALNGLTNGEVIQKMFLDLKPKVGAKNLEVYLDSDTECVGVYDFDWWNRKWGEA